MQLIPPLFSLQGANVSQEEIEERQVNPERPVCSSGWGKQLKSLGGANDCDLHGVPSEFATTKLFPNSNLGISQIIVSATTEINITS